MWLRAVHGVARGAGQGDQALEGSLHRALAVLHRYFIARCYRRRCPAVALQSRVLHYGRRVYLADRQALSSSLQAGLAWDSVDLKATRRASSLSVSISATSRTPRSRRSPRPSGTTRTRSSGLTFRAFILSSSYGVRSQLALPVAEWGSANPTLPLPPPCWYQSTDPP